MPPLTKRRLLDQIELNDHEKKNLQILDTIQAETGKTRRDALAELITVAGTARYYIKHGARHLVGDVGAHANAHDLAGVAREGAQHVTVAGAELEGGRGDVDRSQRNLPSIWPSIRPGILPSIRPSIRLSIRPSLELLRAATRHLAGGLVEAGDELVEFGEVGRTGRRPLILVDEDHHAVGAVAADAELEVGEGAVYGNLQ